MKTEYVLGFAFDTEFENVLLIRKNRPTWQAGLLNGIGGKVESFDKGYEEAMVREFEEEAGLATSWSDWLLFAIVEGKDFRISCYTMTSNDIRNYRSITDEVVHLVPINSVFSDVCPNVPMLISMAICPEMVSGRLKPICIEYCD